MCVSPTDLHPWLFGFNPEMVIVPSLSKQEVGLDEVTVNVGNGFTVMVKVVVEAH